MTSSDKRTKGRFRAEAIQVMTAAESIAEQIRVALFNGTVSPGERLPPEPELAADFGVSRSTVRDAMRILRSQGFVKTARGAKGGNFLVSPQTDVVAESVGETLGLWFEAGTVSIAEIDEARRIVEQACVRLAAERRSDEDLRIMAGILEKAERDNFSKSGYMERDVAFHRQIARASGNRLLELPMNAIHLVRPRTNLLLRDHDVRLSHEHHKRIYEAIRDKDPDRAERVFLEHVEHLQRERDAAMREQQRAAAEISVSEIPTIPKRSGG